jgi:hypothetical protein
MSTPPSNAPDQEFFDLADTYIELANRHIAKYGKGKASASLSFAAARFNAFVAATSVPSGEALRQKHDEAVEYFCGQFRNMLLENLADWIDHFEEYRTPRSV